MKKLILTTATLWLLAALLSATALLPGSWLGDASETPPPDDPPTAGVDRGSMTDPND